MSSDEVRERLRALARSEVSRGGRSNSSVADRLRWPRRALLTAYRQFAARLNEGAEVAASAEWLLDNYYIVERAFRLIEEEFPHEFEQRLPRLVEGEANGQALVFAVAREIVVEYAHIDLEDIVRLLDDVQAVRSLCIAEVWALPILIRAALLEHLAAALTGGAGGQGADADAAIRVAEASSTEQVVAACINGLRTLETTDWKEFFERINETERILREDPAGVYASTDFETRDRCRKVVEELSIFGNRAE